MKLFLDFVVEKGFDYKRETRRQAAAQCVPFFDGQCGRRIVEDLVKGLLSEESCKQKSIAEMKKVPQNLHS